MLKNGNCKNKIYSGSIFKIYTMIQKKQLITLKKFTK